MAIPRGVLFMSRENPIDLENTENKVVYEYLKAFHAHPDLSELLIKAATKSCGDIQVSYQERADDYGPCMVSTDGIIIGFAIGMNSIAFKAGEKMLPIANSTGGEACPECGPNWMAFKPFRGDWPKVDLEFWVLKAYVFEREKVG
jgi:hypothetical protein